MYFVYRAGIGIPVSYWFENQLNTCKGTLSMGDNSQKSPQDDDKRGNCPLQIIIPKVFIQRQNLIRRDYSEHIHAHKQTRRHPHTWAYWLYKAKFTHNIKEAANRDVGQMKIAARNGKHGYSFGEKNVWRFDPKESQAANNESRFNATAKSKSLTAFRDLFLTPTYRALYNAWTEDTFSSSYSQPSQPLFHQ